MSEVTAPTSTPMDALDRLANDAFAGRVVRKDLVRQVKVGANVPVYVLEFLLGKYCASDDPAAIATGLQVVNQTLQENFIRPDESEQAKAKLKRRASTASSTRSTSGSSPARTSSGPTSRASATSTSTSPRTSSTSTSASSAAASGASSILLYNADDDEEKKRPFYIRALKPIQVAAFDMDEYVAGARAVQPRRVARPRDALDRTRASPLRPARQATRHRCGSYRWSSGTTT